MLIKSINWIITDVCNLQCRHCDMWQRPACAVDQDLIGALLTDPVVEQSYERYREDFDISIGGGEPFTHPGLREIVSQIEQKYPGAFKAITTNGVLTKKIYRFLQENAGLKFKLNISIDGLRETHDRIRGVTGAFDRVMQTIRVVKRIFPKQEIEVKMTIMPDNCSQIQDVCRLAQQLGCSFSCKPVEQMDYYTNRNFHPKISFTNHEIHCIRNQLFPIADEMLRNGFYKKARFTKDIPFHLAKKRRHASCSVLWEHITVMPNGDVFFCIKEESAGSILKDSLEDMEMKPRDFQCQSCMLMCGSFKDYDDKPYFETVANIEVTHACNLSCTMCTQKQLQTSGEYMSFGTFADIIRRNEIGHVSFIGGEPFLNADLFRMMGLLDREGKSYEVTTNGTLCTEGEQEKLKQCIGLKKINVSIDGLENEHDRIRGKGVFGKAIQTAIFLNTYFHTSVASVIMADNLSVLPELSHYLRARGIISQKFIYAMDLSSGAIEDTLAKIPGLIIQGPECKRQVKNGRDLMALFAQLEQQSLKVTFEPKLMRKHVEQFLGDQPLGECRQLLQPRYDPDGGRIICEFIRNPYTKELAERIAEAKPAVCTRCCKMDV